MKINKFSKKPENIESRTGSKPIVCYPNDTLENNNLNILHKARKYIKKIEEITIPPRDAKTFKVNSGNFFRIESIDGPQVGDLNLFQAENLNEKF